MPSYLIIETDDGLTVAEIEEGSTAEDTAEREGGLVVDGTIYATYDDAYDAMLLIQADADEDE